MKVIDCFPFFNELDLLEIRLNELKDVVDVFVLTESDKTFTGNPKPLYFDKERFKDFNIVYSVYTDDLDIHAMERERRQKQFNLDYAYDNVFEPGDIIMYGDCDEIPEAKMIKELLKEDWNSIGLIPTLYYYYLNCRQKGENNARWPSIVLTKPTERLFYNVKRQNKVERLIRSGYHFSYLGDVKYKLESWGHADQYDRPPFNIPEHIERCKKEGRDFLGRRIEFEFLRDLNYLPKYVLDNQERFKEWIKR